MKEPLKIGYAGGLTGRVADLGIAGRDGVILAVEEINNAGGINGREVKLLVKDDKQDAETAVNVNEELIQQGVAAIIGHMTSSMSKAGVKAINDKKVFMLSPTTSTNELTGLDDYFFRLYPASAQAAKRLSSHAFKKMGIKRLTVIYDIRNRAHTESWYLSFKKNFESYGGTITAALTYSSGPDVRFLDLARQVSANESDGLFIIANAMDTAMLCQQLAKLDRLMPVITSEWSATEDILKFGGRAVEGIQFFHTFDKTGEAPRFLEFKEAFKKRFGYEAGFASAHAYDSARVIFEALKKNADPSAIKETVIDTGTFQGLQSNIRFDRFGDVERELFLMTIKDGKFITIK
jgi:branched-chain amino acid transport system substrate-binding protein